jgi:uncharacterized RDD family membrane protein YckC
MTEPQQWPTQQIQTPPMDQQPYAQVGYPVKSIKLTPTGRPAAGLAARFTARILDVLLMVAVGFVAMLLMIVLVMVPKYVFGIDNGITEVFSILSGWVLVLTPTLGYVIYCAYFEHKRGQTIGKRVLKIRVSSSTGQRITLGQAFARNVAFGIPLLSFFAWALAGLTIFASQTGQGLHDQLAKNTEVTLV